MRRVARQSRFPPAFLSVISHENGFLQDGLELNASHDGCGLSQQVDNYRHELGIASCCGCASASRAVNCYIPSGAEGVLSTSDTSYKPAYGTTTGWDFATGIGTVNAYNLVHKWTTAAP